jgi:UPF0271 protein
MKNSKKQKVLIIDTSAILSGKTIDTKDIKIITTPGVYKELNPGGRDYQFFQFLLEKGLKICTPSKESIKKVNSLSKQTGEIDRLSDEDKEILALAIDIKEDGEVAIITDDYSIQNMAYILKIDFINLSKKSITKKFIWSYQCVGCGKKFKDNIKNCPICGTEIKNVVHSKEFIKR